MGKQFITTLLAMLLLSGGLTYLFVDLIQDSRRETEEYCDELRQERDSLYLKVIRLEDMIQTFAENNPDVDVLEAANKASKIKYEK